ncbi:uncharacterized protein AB675_5999 [Cyphellophora attinorum]|uniref:DNA-directed RNA polymerase I subunit rpa49 n=1 Tax=Cyphellophora attinorum TaxID=1664694 RepID=A0A0N0NJS8_9EURO|nr:uncharacterized protein AB675_5999 [Phialophora attinorum]KPI36999.1 hypothetical protein AB675_5999 [Phialophora attinorum]
MSDKKRKSSDQGGPNPKRPALQGTVSVKHLSSNSIAKPAIVTSPGTVLAANTTFQAHATRSKDPELLLYSSDHDTIDFTARETRTTTTSEAHTKHYVAIFDPATKQLTVTEAKKLAARSTVRQVEQDKADSDSENEHPTPSQRASRAALVEAFGTKKSRKALQGAAENRLLARGSGNDSLSEAIRSSVKQEDVLADPDFGASQEAAAQSNKPLPPANLTTTDIREVYAISRLVRPRGQATLDDISVAKWESYASRTPPKPIVSAFHFVANRAGPLLQRQAQLLETGESPNRFLPLVKTHIRLLRYIEFLLYLHKFLAAAKPRRQLDRLDRDAANIQDMCAILPFASLLNHFSHFFPDNMPTAPAMTLLRSTILAFTLHIPPAGRVPDTQVLVTEPTDIARDLGKDIDEMLKLYRELGCQNKPLSDTEIAMWGLERLRKGDSKVATKVKFAKLKFPIEFVKVSQGARARGRR